MKLSLRLETIASFVPPCRCAADIGTDHGYIPIRLVESGTVRNAIAMDIRSGPLERAKAHIGQEGLGKEIQTRLSDGLERLKPGEADTVVIAGMGGELMRRILEDGKHLWETVDHWILSPQSEWEEFRRFLAESGFCTVREAMVEEDGKFYLIMDVRRKKPSPCQKGGEPAREIDYRYGSLLLAERSPALRAFLERERCQLLLIRERLVESGGPRSQARLGRIEEELRLVEEAQDEMQGNHRDPGGTGSGGVCM